MRKSIQTWLYLKAALQFVENERVNGVPKKVERDKAVSSFPGSTYKGGTWAKFYAIS